MNTKTAEAPAPVKSASKVDEDFYILDTTATPDVFDSNGRITSGPRVHEQIVNGGPRPFKFEYAKPLKLPKEVALKFLKHEGEFVRTDPDGNVIPFARPPRQPHEMQAGEQFKLADDQCVARLDELTTPALQHRALEMPGGEKFADKPDRQSMIAFIVATRRATATANMSKEPDIKPDEFVPDAEQGEIV